MSATPFDRPPCWLHLDLKGIVPAESALLDWLCWFASLGFNGIVFEYEDRLPWRSWPDTFRPPYKLEQWKRIWETCERLDLEIVPLVQTLGHLEWILKHPQYAEMREGRHVSEICPSHPDVRPRIEAWLDEVIDLHPGSRFVHVGADEAWHLASCSRCAKRASDSRDGKLSVYIDHVAAVCRHVARRGRRPMIWADMFWREKRLDLAAALPKDVVLVDWQYGGAGPWPSTKSLRTSGHALLGASAIRCSYHTTLAQAPLDLRFDNVIGWNARLAAGDVEGVIHTCWGRSNSLRPVYGPWQGWLPAFIAAANPEQWGKSPMRQTVDEIVASMRRPPWESFETSLSILRTTSEHDHDALWRQAAAWWVIAVKHRDVFNRAVYTQFNRASFDASHKRFGDDPDDTIWFDKLRRDIFDDLDALRQQIVDYFHANQLTDAEEFVDTRLGNIRRVLEHGS